MKTTKVFLIAIAATIIAACSSRKKTTSAVSTASSGPIILSKSPDGIMAPGDQELVAIQAQYKDATLGLLKNGHELYTKTACVGCHNAKSIYGRGADEWKEIIDRMAIKANITEAQKDGVYKYVLSIKATQPK